MFNSGFRQQGSNTLPSFGFNQSQQPMQTSSLFGQPAQQPMQAAGASSPFAASVNNASGGAAASPFGSMSGTNSFFGSTMGAQPQQGQGTAAVPFTVIEESDPSKPGKIDKFETITMMPQYQASSLQELRFQDYQANRKGPPPQAASGFGFGQTQPASTGGGLFGQSTQNSFGSSSGFGAANTTSPFGQSGTSQQGGGGGLFGSASQPAASPFGSTNTASSGGLFGQSSAPNNAFGTNNSTTFGSAPAPAATGFGFGSSSTPAGGGGGGLFGQSSANSTSPFGTKPANSGGIFGQSNSVSTGFGFGNTQGQDAFGMANNNANNAAAGSSLFGQNNNNRSSPFGQSGGSSIFGNNANNNGGGGLFGNNSTANNNLNQLGGGSGLFGQSSAQPSGGLFGQSNTGGGLFGQNNNNNNTSSFGSTTGGGIFGQNNAANNSGSGGLFGQSNSMGNAFGQPQQPQPQQQQSGFGFNSTQNKPAGGLFGQSSATTNAFGQANNNNNTAGGLFGKPSTPGGGLFGQNNTSTAQPGFGQSNTQSSSLGGGLFGTQNQQQQQQKPAFGFGQSNAANITSAPGGLGSTLGKPAGGLFGQSNQSGASTGGGGLFGANAGTNTSAPASGGLFGNNNNNNNNNNGGAVTGSTFGSGGGLFGNSSSLNNNQTNSTGTGSGLFGSKPATGTSGGLFGNPNTNSGTTGGLFGGNNAAGSTGQPQPSSGLFGNTSQQGATGSSLFGSSLTNTNNNASGGLFGAGAPQTKNTGQQVSAPVASIDSDAYLSHPLFANVQQSTNGVLQSDEPAAAPKNKASSFKTPTGTLLAQMMLPRPLPAGSRKRGDEGSRNASTRSSSEIESKDTKDKKPLVQEGSERFRSALFSNTTDDIILNTEAFDFAQRGLKAVAFRTEERPKAVSISTPTRSLRRSDEDEPSPQSNSSKAASESKQSESFLTNGSSDDEEEYVLIEESAANASELPNSHESDRPDNEIFDSNGYWISPAKHKLLSMTLRELRKVRDFRVGQRTEGFVEFLEPVDLSLLSDVQAQVCGRIVVFGERSFCLYPNEAERPPVGQGFNVRHRVTLYNIFARSRDTREPVRDPDHPVSKKFMKKLRTLGKFISWSAQTGTWTFEVDPAASA